MKSCSKIFCSCVSFSTFVAENTSFVFSLLLCVLACESRHHFCL
nr:MAG TPA: hypothetical protein [Caudoviricetes sp.]